MTDRLLTQDELRELTGTKSAAKQMRILSEHGINYVRGVNNHIAVTWHSVNNPSRPQATDNGPDFDALRMA